MIGIGNRLGQGGITPFDWEAWWATRTPENLGATTISDSQIDLLWTENGTGYDGISIERSLNNVDFTEIDTEVAGVEAYSDTTFSEPAIIYYRIRAYVGTEYSPYTSVAVVYPAGVRVTTANSCVELDDAASEFYFNNAGADLPFSVLMIVKINDLNKINRIFTRGNASGTSYIMGAQPTHKTLDFAIYNSDNLGNDQIYKKASQNLLNDNNVHRIAYTYSGNELPTGMKIYKDGTVSASYMSSEKFGTYNAMNNRTGVWVGQHVQGGYVSDADVYLLLVCNKELSAAEVTEFQNMADTISGINSLSFYANIKTINRFAGTLTDDLGVHNGSAVTPTFFFMNSRVVDEGLFLPSLTETTFQSTFKDFKLGWFIHWNMETYNKDETNGRTVDTSLPSVFAAPANVNVAAWASLAATSGKIDYAILTVSHIYGFSLYDHQTAEWRGTQIDVGGGVIVPTNVKYDVGSDGCTADKNIVTKFVSEFNAVGIKPMFYYCVGWSRNWCGQKWVKDGYTDPNYQFDKYHDYVRERLQELARLNPFAIWIDVDIYYAPTYQWDLYNAIKAINEDIGVIVNCYNNKDRTDNSFGAFDAGSIEEIDKPALPSNDWWVKEQVIGGVTYPCMKEYCFTSTNGHIWFWKSTNELRTIEALQAQYDYGKTAGVPCVISVSPDEDGVVGADQAALIASINL